MLTLVILIHFHEIHSSLSLFIICNLFLQQWETQLTCSIIYLFIKKGTNEETHRVRLGEGVQSFCTFSGSKIIQEPPPFSFSGTPEFLSYSFGQMVRWWRYSGRLKIYMCSHGEQTHCYSLCCYFWWALTSNTNEIQQEGCLVLSTLCLISKKERWKIVLLTW